MNKFKIIPIAALSIVLTVFGDVPNFELWNKTGSEIKVTISYQLLNGTRRQKVTQQIHPNIKLPIYNVNSKLGLTITFNEANTYVIMPCFEQNCYQTIYLSYDKTGLRPQKGPLYGLLRTTDSGYNNKNNITADFIKKSSLIP